MPMPPPKPSTEGPRDRQVGHETAQIVRALHALGPQTPEDLAQHVGAIYWEPGRFDKAVVLGISDGLLVRTADGRLTTV